MGRAGERRWVVVLLVVDLALLAALGVLAARDATATVPSPPPTTTAAPSDATVDFLMPSRNVACHMTADQVVCGMQQVDVRLGTWPTVRGCPGAHVVLLDVDGVQAVCPRDVSVPLPTGAKVMSYGGLFFPATAPVLDYGQKRTVGDLTCTSRQEGVLCRNAAGDWFNLRKLDGLTRGGPSDNPPS